MKPTETEIPERRYFRIGEVSAITGIEPYVLRYWQTEFSKIRPSRSRSGQRLYRKKDIEAVLEIKDLLYEQRFTIAGAKRHLEEQKTEDFSSRDEDRSLTLRRLKEELVAIRDLLS
jgi:DNA-binding transcriptional MerR regulator